MKGSRLCLGQRGDWNVPLSVLCCVSLPPMRGSEKQAPATLRRGVFLNVYKESVNQIYIQV